MIDKKIIIVGGLGYLGSIITDLLTKRGFDVTVVDCCLYDNEEVEKEIKLNRLIVKNVIDTDIEIYKDAIVVWSCDINIEFFYGVEEFDNINTKIKKKIKEIVNVAERFIRIISFEYLYKMEKAVAYREWINDSTIDNKTEFVYVGALFGPSPRMRWDTYVNKILYQFIETDVIYIQGNWLDRFPIAHVLDAAIYVVKKIVEGLIDDGYVFKGMMNILELAHVIKHLGDFKDKKIVTVGMPKEIIELADFRKNLSDPSSNLADAVKAILLGLEKGMLPDYQNDKYYNEFRLAHIALGLQVMRKFSYVD